MRLLMAVSDDGFVALGPEDNMSWTGGHDKAIFKLLTSVGREPLVCGRKTADLMPNLVNRPLCPVSNDKAKGCSLLSAYDRYPDAWLIGGQTLAVDAIGRGMVDEVFLCNIPVALSGGVPIHLYVKNFGSPFYNVRIGDVVVSVRK